MQRANLRIETRLINEFSSNVHKENEPRKGSPLSEGKNAKEFQKFFKSFKRALKFGWTRCDLCVRVDFNYFKVFQVIAYQ